LIGVALAAAAATLAVGYELCLVGAALLALAAAATAAMTVSATAKKSRASERSSRILPECLLPQKVTFKRG